MDEFPCYIITTEDFSADENLFAFAKLDYNIQVNNGPFSVEVKIEGDFFKTNDRSNIQEFFEKYKFGYLPSLTP